MITAPQPVVLVVDDDPKNIKLMRAVLGSAGYHVLFAADGLIALQIAREAHPDLILLDVMMPGMDGYAVCSCLKEDEVTRDIPVIFLSARDDVEAESHGFELGGADYITKPILLPVLLARVKTHLNLYQHRRSLEGMFRDVMEFAPDAFILADPHGEIVQVNAQAENLFGYSREELAGMHIELLTPNWPGNRLANNQSRQPYELIAETGVPCVRKDGSEFPADINVSPMKTNRGKLFMSVVRNVSERQKAEKALRKSRQSLRELAARSEARREAEKKHIAREVHDELGQVLTALRMDLSLLQMRFGTLDAGLEKKVLNMKTLVDRAIEGVRNVAGNLRPIGLDLGLISSLNCQCDEFALRFKVPCLFKTSGEIVNLAEERSIVLYRIVQESLTNITRYAQATQVVVKLEFTQSALKLTVQDNGCGFDLDASSQKKSFGLLGMQERAIALNGRMDIVSARGHGTQIQVTIPLLDAPEIERK